MGGFMGIGQSKSEKSGEAKLGNIFNWAMPQAQAGQAAGASTLGQAQKYFSGLTQAGRTEGAALAAPALQSAQAQQDALKRQEAAMGTGRAGGTTAAARESASTAGKNIDEILAQTLVGGRAAGAQGLAGIGETQLKNALAQLGISSEAARSIFETGTQKQTALAQPWINALI